MRNKLRAIVPRASARRNTSPVQSSHGDVSINELIEAALNELRPKDQRTAAAELRKLIDGLTAWTNEEPLAPWRERHAAAVRNARAASEALEDRTLSAMLITEDSAITAAMLESLQNELREIARQSLPIGEPGPKSDPEKRAIAAMLMDFWSAHSARKAQFRSQHFTDFCSFVAEAAGMAKDLSRQVKSVLETVRKPE